MLPYSTDMSSNTESTSSTTTPHSRDIPIPSKRGKRAPTSSLTPEQQRVVEHLSQELETLTHRTPAIPLNIPGSPIAVNLARPIRQINVLPKDQNAPSGERIDDQKALKRHSLEIFNNFVMQVVNMLTQQEGKAETAITTLADIDLHDFTQPENVKNLAAIITTMGLFGVDNLKCEDITLVEDVVNKNITSAKLNRCDAALAILPKHIGTNTVNAFPNLMLLNDVKPTNWLDFCINNITAMSFRFSVTLSKNETFINEKLKTLWILAVCPLNLYMAQADSISNELFMSAVKPYIKNIKRLFSELSNQMIYFREQLTLYQHGKASVVDEILQVLLAEGARLRITEIQGKNLREYLTNIILESLPTTSATMQDKLVERKKTYTSSTSSSSSTDAQRDTARSKLLNSALDERRNPALQMSKSSSHRKPRALPSLDTSNVMPVGTNEIKPNVSTTALTHPIRTNNPANIAGMDLMSVSSSSSRSPAEDSSDLTGILAAAEQRLAHSYVRSSHAMGGRRGNIFTESDNTTAAQPHNPLLPSMPNRPVPTAAAIKNFEQVLAVKRATQRTPGMSSRATTMVHVPESHIRLAPVMTPPSTSTSQAPQKRVPRERKPGNTSTTTTRNMSSVKLERLDATTQSSTTVPSRPGTPGVRGRPVTLVTLEPLDTSTQSSTILPPRPGTPGVGGGPIILAPVGTTSSSLFGGRRRSFDSENDGQPRVQSPARIGADGTIDEEGDDLEYEQNISDTPSPL